MLVPLETFSGWPRVDDPSVLASLTVFFGIPILIAVIVIALIEVGARARSRRGDIDTSDPLWVGARESAEVEPVSDDSGTVIGDQATADATTAEERAEGDDTGEHVGGAGARW
jgi:hypothetical protein